VRNAIDESQWQQAFVKELTRHRERTGPRHLSSIFFGGGTPSLMNPQTVDLILKTASQLWGFSPNMEITLEANPNSVEVDKFKALAQSGINRISIGIQSFNADDLKFLGRSHSVEEGKRAIETAQTHFKRVSFDLIYARPQQTLKAWQRELEEALGFGTEHLSLYQLTIEPGTAFATQYARGAFVLPDEALSADLYHLTAQLCDSQGLRPYEISNYAKPGCESKHNLTYWRYGDYMGIGPGAHGRLTLSTQEGNQRVATRQYRAPETWLARGSDARGEAGGAATEAMDSLNLEQQTDEMLLMGLRLSEPFDLKRLPLPWQDVIDPHALARLSEGGFIDLKDEQILLHPPARLCLNEILRQLRR
jgi:oxygen-independent coproporphyrinogen-3 oxidase